VGLLVIYDSGVTWISYAFVNSFFIYKRLFDDQHFSWLEMKKIGLSFFTTNVSVPNMCVRAYECVRECMRVRMLSVRAWLCVCTRVYACFFIRVCVYTSVYESV
jgi:hypothetical protein